MNYLLDFVYLIKDSAFNLVERFVLDCLLSGISQRTISLFLGVTYQAVNYHKRKIFNILSCALNIHILELMGFNIYDYVGEKNASVFKLIEKRRSNKDICKELGLSYQAAQLRFFVGCSFIRLDKFSITYLFNLVQLSYYRRAIVPLANKMVNWGMLEIRDYILKNTI